MSGLNPFQETNRLGVLQEWPTELRSRMIFRQ